MPSSSCVSVVDSASPTYTALNVSLCEWAHDVHHCIYSYNNIISGTSGLPSGTQQKFPGLSRKIRLGRLETKRFNIIFRRSGDVGLNEAAT